MLQVICLFLKLFHGINLTYTEQMKANDMLQRWFEDDDAMERALSGEYVKDVIEYLVLICGLFFANFIS